MTERIKIESVDTGSFTIKYFRFGSGKDTLVILPGLSVRSVMNYADSVAASYRITADSFTVYVFDRREELPPVYTVSDMARDTSEAIDKLGLGAVSLLGASQGGMIAMEIAASRPDMVRKLVLASTAARVPEDAYGAVEKWVQLAKAGDSEGLYLAFGEAVYPRGVFEMFRSYLIEESKLVTAKDLERFVILAEGMRGFDATGEIGRIACPVFVVGSKDDEVLGPDAAEELAKLFGERSGLSVHIYDGYGHAAYDTAPDVKERILRFLK